jgi:hypothetical protein
VQSETQSQTTTTQTRKNVVNTYYFHAATLAALGFTILQLSALGKATMSTQDSINAVVTQLGKAKGEIVSKIADLQAAIDAGVPAEQLDLTALTEAAQALDDVVPDAPVVPAE